MWGHGGAGLTERSERGSLSAVVTHDKLGISWFMQILLLEEVSGVADGIVVQTAKNVITKRLVKRKRLKVEGVAMCVEATASMCLVLRRPHKASANAVAPDSLCHPKLFDEKPVPVRITNEAAD